MYLKTPILLVIITLSLFTVSLNAQNFPVTLRVVDKTFGIRTSNSGSTDEKNLVAGLSENLKFQGLGTGGWYYPLHVNTGTTGGIIKNDTAWIWQAVIQAPIGTHYWYPCLKSSSYKPMNKISAYYGENDNLNFTVDATGKVTGTTQIIIQDKQFPLTLKVIDKSKGTRISEQDLYIQGGLPSNLSLRTNFQDEFVAHNAKPVFSTQSFEMNSGVNIGVWLSQTSSRGESMTNYFTKADLKNLADMGFDHIRLPVDEKELFDTNGNYIQTTRQLIHSAISWCQEFNMRIVLDLHIIRSHYFNDATADIPLWKSTAEQDKLVELWNKLSLEYGSYPNSLLAYELLNEVNAPSAAIWNTLSARIIAKIRLREPNRMLIFGGISHNSASALTTLTVPANDKNIALVFHSYSPMLITHYQAGWLDGLKNLSIPLHYPGQAVAQENVDTITIQRHLDVVNYYNGYYNKAVLKEKMQVAITRANQLGLKLYCTEYGCISYTNKEIKYKWMRDVSEIFRENNIAFSVWGWKANFGILDENDRVRDTRVIEAITKGGGKKFNFENAVEKNDTAWIWSTTVEARTGSYFWLPNLYSTGKSINDSFYKYDMNGTSNGLLQFGVGLNGEVSGNTMLVIPETTNSVTQLGVNNDVKICPSVFDRSISITGVKESIELYNSVGQKLVDRTVNSSMSLDTSSFAKGLYILVADKKYSYKLIK